LGYKLGSVALCDTGHMREVYVGWDKRQDGGGLMGLRSYSAACRTLLLIVVYSKAWGVRAVVSVKRDQGG